MANVTTGARPIIGFVRGPFENEHELFPLPLLQDEFRVVLTHTHKLPGRHEFEKQRTMCLGSIMERVPKVRRAYRWFIDGLLGDGSYLMNFERLVRGSQVIDVAEQFRMMSFQAARYALKAKIPLIVTVYENTPFYREENPRTQRIKRFVAQAASAFIAKTNQIRDSLMAEGVPRDRIYVIYNGLDTQGFSPKESDDALRARYRLAPSDQVVLYVGKLLWQKGAEDLLRSFRAVVGSEVTKESPYKLLIIGAGKEQGRLRRLVSAFGIEGMVRIAAPVPFGTMPEITRGTSPKGSNGMRQGHGHHRLRR